MTRTDITAYFKSVDELGTLDQITTYINLSPVEAARYYLNYTLIHEQIMPNGEKTECKYKCYKIRTDGAQIYANGKWRDFTDIEPYAVGTFDKYDDKLLYTAPYNKGGKQIII